MPHLLNCSSGYTQCGVLVLAPARDRSLIYRLFQPPYPHRVVYDRLHVASVHLTVARRPCLFLEELQLPVLAPQVSEAEAGNGIEDLVSQ